MIIFSDAFLFFSNECQTFRLFFFFFALPALTCIENTDCSVQSGINWTPLNLSFTVIFILEPSWIVPRKMGTKHKLKSFTAGKFSISA